MTEHKLWSHNTVNPVHSGHRRDYALCPLWTGVRYGQVSVVENFSGHSLGGHYYLLQLLVGTVMNGTKPQLIKQYMYIQYMWAINIVGQNVINHTALLHSTAWKPGGVWGP